MGNDYDGALVKPDQTRNYKLISDPYLRPGHRILYRYDGLSCQHRSPIQVCDPRKLKTAKSRKIVDLPIPDYAAKHCRKSRQNCNSPVSFSPPPANLSNVNLDGFNLSREELIKLVQSYQNAKANCKRRKEKSKSRHASPQWVPKRSRQGSESSNISYSTPNAESRNSNDLSIEKTEPKESLDSRIAALLGTDQQQQARPALIFPPFFPPNSMYTPPPFYDPLRPPPPLPFPGFVGFPTFSTRPPNYAERTPGACMVPPAPQCPPPSGPCPEELSQQVVCILCGELNTIVRRDLSRKVLSGVAYKCIDDWYEANDKRNKILQSGKYLKANCMVNEESLKHEELTNGPLKREATCSNQSWTDRPYQPIPKFSTTAYKQECKKVERNDSMKEVVEEKSEQLNSEDTTQPDLPEMNEEHEIEVRGEVFLYLVFPSLGHPLESEHDGRIVECTRVDKFQEFIDVEIEQTIEDNNVFENVESEPSSYFDMVLLPATVCNDEVCACGGNLRKVLPRYLPRTAEEEIRNTRSYLTDGIDIEDMTFLKAAYREIMNARVRPAWLENTHWVDHPSTKVDTSTTACARAFGYRKLSPSKKKNVQYGPPSSKFSPPVAVKTRSRKEGALRSVGREVRSMQRRLMANIADMDFAEIFRFSQLKLRKKRLQFGRSRIHDWGLFACEQIAAEEMVIEYVGETIRQTVADKREQRLMMQALKAGRPPTSASSYLFRIDSDIIIDATNCGNLARFINHSCDPNCYAKIITVDQCKKVVIYSKREISAGEEITYDYKFPLEDKKIPCNCGAFNCRKTLN